MKSFYRNELKNCPVCERKFLEQGLKNHIINTAKAEVFKSFFYILKIAKNKPYTFSSAMVRKQCPHTNFMIKNIKNKEKFDL